MGELIKLIAWPVCVLIIVIVLAIIFRKPIANKIGDVISVEGEGSKWKVRMNIDRDKLAKKVTVPSKPSPQIIQPKGIPSAEAFGRATISTEKPKLSEDEIEQSRQRAQQRLDEDTKKAGHQRGKLYQLTNKSYGIAWEVNVSDVIVIKDDAKSGQGKAKGVELSPNPSRRPD